MIKLIAITAICYSLIGCSTVKEAHSEFRREINGFKSEWARVILKQEVHNEDIK